MNEEMKKKFDEFKRELSRIYLRIYLMSKEEREEIESKLREEIKKYIEKGKKLINEKS